MFQKFPRKILFYLALSAIFLLLLAGMRQIPQVSAQGSTEYRITLTIFQNTDCSVGRYSVETSDGRTFERLSLKGVKSRDGVQCSLIFEGNFTGLGGTVYASGIGVFAGSLKLQKAEIQNDGMNTYIETFVTGPQPSAGGSPIQQQIILYLGN
jgi:hypothetical protein